MKLIVQIPALHREETLATAKGAIPQDVPGISGVEGLDIDDGSTDRMVEVAKVAGADHILRMASNVGLARVVIAGVEEALSLGVDNIVNLDANNQNCADDMLSLIKPVVDRQAQIVVGARSIVDIESSSPSKEMRQQLGSGAVRHAGGATILCTPSGFSAYARDAAARLSIINTYTHTLETVFQAVRKLIPMRSMPIRFDEVAHVS